MVYDANKYHPKFAWLPKTMSNGQRIWWDRYYEATLRHVIMHELGTYYRINRLSNADYLIETLKGNIVNGVDQGWWRGTMLRKTNAKST